LKATGDISPLMLKVSEENHKRVMRLGNKLQSVNDIVGMLLDEYGKNSGVKRK
jgi:hypothetical protein